MLRAQGGAAILVRGDTAPEDVGGMHASEGILTQRGGMTSHAAVVARGLGRPCVSGAGEVQIDFDNQLARIGKTELKTGDIITVDGTSGNVMRGEVPTLEPELTGAFATLMGWADDIRTMGIRTNAETPPEAARARKLGAEGIGLCRTEHMFFDPERILLVRQMILAQDAEKRREALEGLMPNQKSDFAALFEIMKGLPVTIRLLDPPLHEFLPAAGDDIDALAEALEETPAALRARIVNLSESNPILSHRGSRLAITAPEIYDMQLRAIFSALSEADATQNVEVMFPLISDARELAVLIERVAPIAEAMGIAPDRYSMGAMIEVPRAALLADRLAEKIDFFSFGTNDLTQTALGISRDDAANFMHVYQEAEIYETDPFVSIDVDGVGQLVHMGADKGRSVRADIKLGICGEHGGDPKSVAFCETVGLDYVSCSPFRVPIARLAAAQATLTED